MQAYTYFEIQWAYFQPANNQMETKQRKREEKKKKKKKERDIWIVDGADIMRKVGRLKIKNSLWQRSINMYVALGAHVCVCVLFVCACVRARACVRVCVCVCVSVCVLNVIYTQ